MSEPPPPDPVNVRGCQCDGGCPCSTSPRGSFTAASWASCSCASPTTSSLADGNGCAIVQKPRDTRGDTPNVSDPADGSFSIFAFHHGRDDNYRRDRVRLDRIDQAVRWALARDVTTINIELTDQPPADPNPLVTNHGCNDRDCPGGC